MENTFSVIIKEYRGHINGYGFLSDIDGTHYYGIGREQIELFLKQGANIKSKFIEDNTIPPYIYGHLSIPRGLLQIIAEFKIGVKF